MVRIITDPLELEAAKDRARHLRGWFGKISIHQQHIPFRIAKFEENIGCQKYTRLEGREHSLSYAIDLGFDNFAGGKPPPGISLFLPEVGPRGEDLFGGLMIQFSQYEFGCITQNGTYILFLYEAFTKAAKKITELREIVSLYCRCRT